MKKIGIITSGGDAPGMNAAIRAVVRYGIKKGLQCVGVKWGFRGLLTEDFVEMGVRSVSNIIQMGGTIIKTSRCPEFKEQSNIELARDNLVKHGFDGLIIAGGNGSLRGAFELNKIWSGKIIGLPATIDNDIWGTELTIGFDTALNTAVEAIDKIRDTSDSHGDRIFVVEVMGRDAGFIALSVAIAGGAEAVLLPERKEDLTKVAEELGEGKRRGKTSSIVIAAEGAHDGGSQVAADIISKISGYSNRVLVLGHMQRGGSPSNMDRVLASELGVAAVEAIINGEGGLMMGKVASRIVRVPLYEACSKKKPLDEHQLEFFPMLNS